MVPPTRRAPRMRQIVNAFFSVIVITTAYKLLLQNSTQYKTITALPRDRQTVNCSAWWKTHEFTKEVMGYFIQEKDVAHCEVARVFLEHQKFVFSKCMRHEEDKDTDASLSLDCTNILKNIGIRNFRVTAELRDARKGVKHMNIGDVAFYSKSVMEYFIYRMFFEDWRGDGTFFEVGAVEGLDDANTLFFEETLGWRGVLMEPTLCSLPPDGWLLKNRDTQNTFVHGALCPELKSFRSKTWGAASGRMECRAATVECKPLLDHVSVSAYPRYDFMIIDVEGAELSVLKSIDFSRLEVAVLLIEWRPKDIYQRRQYLEQFGYICFMAEGRKAKGAVQWGGDEICWNSRLVTPKLAWSDIV